MSKHASPTIVGAFVVSAFALVLAGIFVFGGGRYFHNTARVIVYFDGSIAGLKIGAPVKFRGIEIGSVKDIRISMTGALRDPHHIRIPVLLELDEKRLSRQGVRDVDFDDPNEIKRIVGLGLRAELGTESFVTGVRYVALDVRPDTPARLVLDTEYPEIPSVRAATAEIPDKVNRILGNLAEVDVQHLADSVQSTVEHADHLLASPDLARAVARFDQLTADLDGALRDLRPTIGAIKDSATSAGTAIAPVGRVADQLDRTLRELQGAARSLRRLADQLGRDPGVIVRGGRP